jgi:hypothetical protein
LKLSEAIRLGAMLRPQGIGGHTRATTCALQAAAEAIGVPIGFYLTIRNKFPILDRAVTFPETTLVGLVSMVNAIWNLNDS